jgi:hypothetical protein
MTVFESLQYDVTQYYFTIRSTDSEFADTLAAKMDGLYEFEKIDKFEFVLGGKHVMCKLNNRVYEENAKKYGRIHGNVKYFLMINGWEPFSFNSICTRETIAFNYKKKKEIEEPDYGVK